MTVAAPRSRWPTSVKVELVLRLLGGESLSALERETGRPARQLSAWRRRFLAGGEAYLEGNPERAEPRAVPDPPDEPAGRVAELEAENRMLMRRVALAHARRSGNRLPHPYCSEPYARAFGDADGQLLRIPEWDSYVLVRETRSGRPHATGIRPITPLDPQSDVEGGLEALRRAGIVSVSLVADPMWCPDPSVLRGAFDICQRFREHYFVDREAPVRYHKRHRRRLSEARRAGAVEELQLADHLGRWHELYGQNVANRRISEPFTAEYFEQLSTLPTLRTIAVLVGDEIVTMTLWLQHEDTLYLHDSASDSLGFAISGAYAAHAHVIERTTHWRYALLGGSAGVDDERLDGLAMFRRGFSNGSVFSWFCSSTLTAPARPRRIARSDEPGLSTLAAGHRRRFAWYDELVGGRDVEQLADLPTVDERVLLEHYYTRAHKLPDALEYQTSGTSTGRRKTVLYSPADHAAYCAQRSALFADFLRDVPRGSVAISDLGTGHAAASARTIFHEIGLEPREIDYRRPIRDHVALLNRAQPAVLFTMPAILDRLSACDDRLDIRPRKIIVVGDVAPPNWRRHVARTFDLRDEDVLDIVGSIEVGAIAYHSAATGLYHFHDHILAEAVDPSALFPESDARLSGDQGILLLTSFAREYFPALRYVTNDVVRGLRRIHLQGRTIFACDRLEGRFAGEVKHGERLSSYDLCTAVNEVFPGCPFEVVEDGGVEIRVATDRVRPDQEAVIADFLMAANPDVGEMVRAGLVRPVVVSAISAAELASRPRKRLFRVGDR